MLRVVVTSVMLLAAGLAFAQEVVIEDGRTCEVSESYYFVNAQGERVVLQGDITGSSGADGVLDVGDVVKLLRQVVDLEDPTCTTAGPVLNPGVGADITVRVFSNIHLRDVVGVRMWIGGLPRTQFVHVPTEDVPGASYISPPVEVEARKVHPNRGDMAYEVRFVEVRFDDARAVAQGEPLANFSVRFSGADGDLFDPGGTFVFYTEILVLDQLGAPMWYRGGRDTLFGYDPDRLLGTQVIYPEEP